MPPRSAKSFISKKKPKRIIYFGKTALNNARKSFDEWKKYKDYELFSRLQHRIKTEFVKSKNNDIFYKNDLRLNIAKKAVEESKRLALLDTQLKNYEKFRNHSFLLGRQMQLRKDKINNYIINYQKKEKKSKEIISMELEKRKKNENEYPIDVIQKNLNDIKKSKKEKNNKLKTKLKIKDIYLLKFKANKEEIHKQKKAESDLILERRNYRINQLITEHNKLREKKRKEIEKRDDDINEFLYQKELINIQKRNINDDYNFRYQRYSGNIDHILFKKDLSKESLNQIKFMASFDPAISGLGQNLD